MSDGVLTNGFVGVCEGAVLVDLILEKVGVYGTRANSIVPGEPLDVVYAVESPLKIPEYMERESGAYSSERVYLSSITEFLLDISGRGRLKKLPEPRARIGKSPRWKLDAKSFECAKYLVCQFRIHEMLFTLLKTQY